MATDLTPVLILLIYSPPVISELQNTVENTNSQRHIPSSHVRNFNPVSWLLLKGVTSKDVLDLCDLAGMQTRSD